MTTIETYTVTLADGSTQTACCGRRVLALLCAGATGYVPHNDARFGLCCRSDTALDRAAMRQVERQAYEYAAIYAALRH